jgi:hypothetical protein
MTYRLAGLRPRFTCRKTLGKQLNASDSQNEKPFSFITTFLKLKLVSSLDLGSCTYEDIYDDHDVLVVIVIAGC